MSGVVTLGETMGLFRATSVGSSAHVADFQLGIGGAESNVAIGLARLGAEATWIGRVGADSIGERVLRELRAERVTTLGIVDEDARTGLMVKEHPTADSTTVAYYRSGSAGSRLRPADLDLDVIRSADVLHVTGITLAISETASAAVARAVSTAVDAGVPVSFDVNHRPSLWASDPSPSYRALAAQATIVFAGLDEAALLAAGSTADELGHGIAALGPSQVLVKLGADGCHALIDGATHVVPAIAVRPLDTVGAGDAFVAGYLADLLADLPPAARLDTAVRTGAFACLGPGDWESYPRRGQLATLGGDGDPVTR